MSLLIRRASRIDTASGANASSSPMVETVTLGPDTDTDDTARADGTFNAREFTDSGTANTERLASCNGTAISTPPPSDELLNQAYTLLDSKYVIAATTLAGGVLESHLRYLAKKHGLLRASAKRAGAIAQYNADVAQARDMGKAAVYDATDGKLIKAWDKMRNRAAHDPGTYDRSADDVRSMIDGVRWFISRTT